MASRALAYIIEGSFPSYFAGKPIPEKPAEAAAPHAKEDKQTGDEGAKNPEAGRLEHKGDFLGVSKPAKIFIIGSSEMLTDNLITEQGDNPNSTLIMNIIDVLNNKSDIALMRSKIQSFNPLEVKDEKIKVAAKAFNIAGLPVIVVIFGLFVWLRLYSHKKLIEVRFYG